MKSGIQKKVKKPWPTKEVMEQIYEMNLWGDSSENKFYSGDGSHNEEIVIPYLEVVADFLSSFPDPLVICDLGCGDFNVGKQLIKFSKKYIAIDIVESLINYNKERFRDDRLEFHCLDVAKENLPKGDCVILRQVLQHLSNAEIQGVLGRLSSYKHVILTEHLPLGVFIPNRDIISGQGIRIKKHSGVDMLSPPFNFKIQKEDKLLEVALGESKGVLVTTVYTL